MNQNLTGLIVYLSARLFAKPVRFMRRFYVDLALAAFVFKPALRVISLRAHQRSSNKYCRNHSKDLVRET
jgi:hypothetical protein